MTSGTRLSSRHRHRHACIHARTSNSQAHRVILSREKEVVGDVHASCVACSHHQNVLQSTLHEITAEVQYIVGYPPKHFYENNKTILYHTLLRREVYVKGSIHNDSVDIEQYPEAMEILSVLNGDWTIPRIQFYTAGR